MMYLLLMWLKAFIAVVIGMAAVFVLRGIIRAIRAFIEIASAEVCSDKAAFEIHARQKAEKAVKAQEQQEQ